MGQTHWEAHRIYHPPSWPSSSLTGFPDAEAEVTDVHTKIAPRGAASSRSASSAAHLGQLGTNCVLRLSTALDVTMSLEEPSHLSIRQIRTPVSREVKLAQGMAP